MDQFYSTKDQEAKTITIFQQMEGNTDKVLAQLEYGSGPYQMRERDADQLASEIIQALNENNPK